MQAKLPAMSQAPFAPHPTLLKFGYPGTLIHEGKYWSVLVRPAQPTLGSLILCVREDVRSYGKLVPEAFAEQGELIARIERFLAAFCVYEKINYLMLMMVDPQVHFHIIPRYSEPRVHHGHSFPDSGWPGLPDLAASVSASDSLVHQMQQRWKDTP